MVEATVDGFGRAFGGEAGQSSVDVFGPVFDCLGRCTAAHESFARV